MLVRGAAGVKHHFSVKHLYYVGYEMAPNPSVPTVLMLFCVIHERRTDLYTFFEYISWGKNIVNKIQWDRQKQHKPELAKWLSDIVHINIIYPEQRLRRFADVVFECIFVNGKSVSSIWISLPFIIKSSTDNTPALFQVLGNGLATGVYRQVWLDWSWLVTWPRHFVAQCQWMIHMELHLRHLSKEKSR